MIKNKKVILFGSLREDIYINHDFSVPMQIPERKLTNYKSVVGGSVYNTGRFLYEERVNFSLYMYTWNYTYLINRVIDTQNGFNIIPLGESICQHPISIIGLDSEGEKKIISSDGNLPDYSTLKQLLNINEADLFYSSFYEVNKENYLFICKIMDYLKKQGTIIFMDLCPLIIETDNDILFEILSWVEILSGNQNEYACLMKKIGIRDENEMYTKFPNVKIILEKKGKDGAVCLVQKDDKTNTYTAKLASVISATNTTGCGDVFNASIIEGLCYGKSINETITDAINNSSRVAEGGLSWI